jgi:hypothetical protein
MPAEDRASNVAKIGRTGWISVHVSYDGQTICPRTPERESEQFALMSDERISNEEPSSGLLFERTAEASLTLSERFPRLTVAVIALALLGFSITAEIECLSKAGYYWQ